MVSIIKESQELVCGLPRQLNRQSALAAVLESMNQTLLTAQTILPYCYVGQNNAEIRDRQDEAIVFIFSPLRNALRGARQAFDRPDKITDRDLGWFMEEIRRHQIEIDAFIASVPFHAQNGLNIVETFDPARRTRIATRFSSYVEAESSLSRHPAKDQPTDDAPGANHLWVNFQACVQHRNTVPPYSQFGRHWQPCEALRLAVKHMTGARAFDQQDGDLARSVNVKFELAIAAVHLLRAKQYFSALSGDRNETEAALGVLLGRYAVQLEIELFDRVSRYPGHRTSNRPIFDAASPMNPKPWSAILSDSREILLHHQIDRESICVEILEVTPYRAQLPRFLLQGKELDIKPYCGPTDNGILAWRFQLPESSSQDGTIIPPRLIHFNNRHDWSQCLERIHGFHLIDCYAPLASITQQKRHGSFFHRLSKSDHDIDDYIGTLQVWHPNNFPRGIEGIYVVLITPNTNPEGASQILAWSCLGKSSLARGPKSNHISLQKSFFRGMGLAQIKQPVDGSNSKQPDVEIRLSSAAERARFQSTVEASLKEYRDYQAQRERHIAVTMER